VAQDNRKAELQQKARNKALKKVGSYKRLFTSPDGKVVLDDLKAAFDQELNVPGDSHGTHVRVGNYEVLQYIKEIMEIEDNG
jgi:hypothetical protein